MKRSLVVLFLVPVILFAFVSVSNSQYTVIQLSKDYSGHSTPQISNNGHMTWTASTGEIFLYDGTSITSIADPGSVFVQPQINDSGHVVWWADDGPGYEIFLYDGASTTQITNNDFWDGIPLINNNGYVAWCGIPDSDKEIFLYDGTSTTQITNNDYLDCPSQINDHGYVVWSADDGTDYEIFLYDGTGTGQITNNDSWDRHPRINDHGYVVWSADDGSDYEIVLYDGTSTTQITNNDVGDYDPQINNNGYVVWHGSGSDGSPDSEIFLYDGTSTTQITNNDVGDYDPQINNNGYVVWHGSASDGSDDEIFLYDGTGTTQITNNDSWDSNPGISDNGYVAFITSGDGIFLAVPCSEHDDNDGDGYVSSACGGNDCNDDNPDVNPGETEVCDGLDNDCDGSPGADEVDGDSDNVMICQGDCDDSNGNIYPNNSNTNCNCEDPIPQGTTENCSDFEDNDCDGITDCPPPYRGFCESGDGSTFCCMADADCGQEGVCTFKRGRCGPGLTGTACNNDLECGSSGYCVHMAQCVGGERDGEFCLPEKWGICTYWGFPNSFCLPGDECAEGPCDFDTILHDCSGGTCEPCVEGCYIATASLGSELENKTEILRIFRDTYLLDNAVGNSFVTAYYKYSPPLADYIAERDWLRFLVRILLLPVVGLVSLFV